MIKRIKSTFREVYVYRNKENGHIRGQKMNESMQIQEDTMEEIELRKLIEIFLAGRWLIIAITTLAVVAAALASFFILHLHISLKLRLCFPRRLRSHPSV